MSPPKAFNLNIVHENLLLDHPPSLRMHHGAVVEKKREGGKKKKKGEKGEGSW